MHVAVFGATGGTGHQFVEQALGQGHTATVLVRDRAKLALEHAGLTVMTGDVLNPADVTKTITGADAVLISLGNTANNPKFVVSTGTNHIVQAMQVQGVRRLIVITALGVGDSYAQVPLVFKAILNTVLRHAYDDKEKQEQLVRESGLDWIIIRPGGLGNGPLTGNYRAGVDGDVRSAQVSRADVAHFALQQLSDDTYLHQTPAISG